MAVPIPLTRLRRAAWAGAVALLLASPAMAQSYQEAPELADAVASGQLPPVAERLPEQPLVVEPMEATGSYGGTWRLAMASASDIGTLVRTIGYENFTRWEPWSPDDEQTDIFPGVKMNVAESVEVSPDSTTYTFHLRRGLKWSDGHPYTADDVMFWYNDVFLNEELMPAKPSWLARDDKPVTVEKVDDYTVTFTYARPFSLLLQWMAVPANDREPNAPTAYPRHYLKQFHKDYNSDIEAVVARENQQNWVSLFHQKADAWANPDVPRLNPWIVTTGIGQGDGSRVVAKRNPYYWKVDPDGNQLPYMDEATIDIVADKEVMLLKAANGDFDMVDSYIGFVTTSENKATFFENQERGGYEFYDVLPNRANLMIFSLNMTAKDPVKREIFSNIDFRRALSVATNRDEIIELVYLGQGRPYQVVERPESPLFDEEMATQYTQYDPDLANRMLDEAGFAERDANGLRLGPDGNPIRITVDISPLRQPWIDSAELMRRYWREVGIELFINTVDTTFLNQRVETNAHEAGVWSASAGVDTIIDPKYYFPFSWASFFAPAWGQWYADAPGAQEPPEAAKRQMDLFNQLQAEQDPAARLELMRQVMAISKEQLYTLGIVQPTTDYGIINTRLRNVPGVLIASSEFVHPGAANPEQFFFEPAP
ncbi:ABC transporter substrate-binding protein [Marinivivus vitaminiproducens]|uniref:ABC transporter substrate-binding protein n=1 Tax=Marinivivus vitaminiproducens TaxID=3035935 RepID=UPI0027996B5C|nr:ABC transporter substrate-binding protein [Geminicoccaceae bacterium SCSIO 64248]